MLPPITASLFEASWLRIARPDPNFSIDKKNLKNQVCYPRLLVVKLGLTKSIECWFHLQPWRWPNLSPNSLCHPSELNSLCHLPSINNQHSTSRPDQPRISVDQSLLSNSSWTASQCLKQKSTILLCQLSHRSCLFSCSPQSFAYTFPTHYCKRRCSLMGIFWVFLTTAQ